MQPEAIEVVAYRLRKKLAATGAQLVTLRGLGYLLQGADARDAPGAALSLRSQLLLGILLPVLLLVVRQHREPVPPGAARGRHGLRPHAAGHRPSRSASCSRSAGGGDAARAAGRPCPTRRWRPSRPTTAAACSTRSAASRGEMVSGFEDLPAWRGTLPDKGTVRRAGRLLRRPLPRRAGARGGAAAAGGRRRRPGHGDDPGGRDAGAAPDAGAPDPGRHAVAPGRAAGGDRRAWWCGWCSARRGRCASSARALRGARRERPRADRRGRRAARAAAAARRHQPGDGAAGAPAGAPEALRARHLAPAAHAAGGAEDAGAVGAARRRRAGAGAARDRPHGRARHRSWPTRCWRWPRSSSCASRATRRWSTGRRSCARWRSTWRR